MRDEFDFQPTLIGPRLTVRPIVATDHEAVFLAASDPAIWELHPARDRWTDAGFRPYFDSALESGSAFAIVENATGSIVGSSRYHGHDATERVVEIGWTFLVRACWGGGLNAELKGLMLGHAFHYVDTVVFWVGETNIRSRRAMEKLGARLLPGTHVRRETGDAPSVIYAISRIHWPPDTAF